MLLFAASYPQRVRSLRRSRVSSVGSVYDATLAVEAGNGVCQAVSLVTRLRPLRAK
jgi:hypothetical protein